MSREDWEIFEELKRKRKAAKALKRQAFTGGPGWVRHHETHWGYTLLGDKLDYWPGTDKFRWRGKTKHGSAQQVNQFIIDKELSAQKSDSHS